MYLFLKLLGIIISDINFVNHSDKIPHLLFYYRYLCKKYIDVLLPYINSFSLFQ